MPRKSLPHSKDHFYYITAGSFNQDSFFICRDAVEKLLISNLNKLKNEFDIQVGSVVVEQNKFHLLILSPKEPINRIMYFLMRRLTRAIQKRSNRINHIFRARYKGTLILQESQLKHIHLYLKGLAEDGLSPFSHIETASLICGLRKTVFEYRKDKGSGRLIRPT